MSSMACSAEFMRSTDDYPVVHKVPRPYLTLLYFKRKDFINKRNHTQQYELALEKIWLTVTIESFS